MSIRDEIAELGREQDALLSEHAEWMARRQAERETLMRKSDAEGIMYRTTEQIARAQAAPADAAPSDDDPWKDWNAWVKGHLAIERQAIREELEGTLVAIIVELREEWHEEVKTALAKRDAEIANLRGQVETLTRLYAGKSADVVDLPNWKPKDVA